MPVFFFSFINRQISKKIQNKTETCNRTFYRQLHVGMSVLATRKNSLVLLSKYIMSQFDYLFTALVQTPHLHRISSAHLHLTSYSYGLMWLRRVVLCCCSRRTSSSTWPSWVMLYPSPPCSSPWPSSSTSGNGFNVMCLPVKEHLNDVVWKWLTWCLIVFVIGLLINGSSSLKGSITDGVGSSLLQPSFHYSSVSRLRPFQQSQFNSCTVSWPSCPRATENKLQR